MEQRSSDEKTAAPRGLHAWLTNLWGNLGGRIVSLTFLTCFLIFVVMVCVLYFLQQQSISRSLVMERENLCGEANAVAENACSYLRGVADYCSVEFDIEYILAHRHDDPAATEMAAEMFSFFQPRNYILNIVLYNADGTPVQYMAIDASHTPLSQAENPIFQSLLSRQKTYVWQYTDSGASLLFKQDNSPRESLWRVVKNSNNTTILGAIVVSMDARKLLDYEVAYTSGYRRNFLLFDRESQRMVSNYTGQKLTGDELARLNRLLPDEAGGELESSVNGAQRQIFYRKIADTSLVTLYIPEENLFASMQGLYVIIAFAFCLFVLALLPLLGYITRYLTRPLERLTHEMEQFSHGNYSANFPAAMNDTIGKLGRTFNSMVAENRNLIEQTYIAQLKAKEAELILLQAQINPHFIYNLINSIQWSALSHGEKDTANIAYSLGQVLRISLNRGNSTIPVEKECELVSYYLTLQKSRYGAKLNYNLHCEEEAKPVLIPKLIVQPLVENSIVHGTEKLIEAIHIDIHISVDSEQLFIEIEDDGAGIPTEILEKLPDCYTGDGGATTSSGFAIRNIYERLSLFYGPNQFEFTISSELNCGTYATIRLPLKLPERQERRLPCTPS